MNCYWKYLIFVFILFQFHKMTQYLPPNLLALFAPRDPIPYIPPVDKLTWEKRTDGYSGLANLIQRFEVQKNVELLHILYFLMFEFGVNMLCHFGVY